MQRTPELPRGTDRLCLAARPKGEDEPQETQELHPRATLTGNQAAGCVPENPPWLWAGCSTAPLPPRALELFLFVRGTELATHMAAPR